MPTVALGHRRDARGPVCGAKTRTCVCGHHKSLHLERKGPCTAGCGDCPAFTAKPCQVRDGLGPSGRCRRHKGGPAAGPAHHLFKHGRYSIVAKALPKALARNYVTMVEDPQLLSLRSEIAVTRLLGTETLRRIAEVEEAGPAAFKAAQKVRTAWRAFERAHDEGGDLDVAMTRVTDAVVALSNAVSPAQLAAEAREEHRKQMFTLARLEQVEGQSLETLHNMITAERALAMRQVETDIFLEALEQHEPNREIRNAIRRAVGARLGELAARRDGAAVAAGGGPGVLDVQPVDPAPADG